MEDSKELGLEQLTNCAMCADMCKHSCPTYLATGKETITPQKLARLILYEEKAVLEDRRGFFDVVFQSAMCGACKAHCIYGNHDLRDYILRARSKAFQEGMLPNEVRTRVETFAKFGNPRGERQLLDKGTGVVGYFISCSAYADEQLPKAMDRIVSASKEQVHHFGGADICCGAPLYYAGDVEGLRKAAEKMKAEIEKRGLERVIADCPNCLKIMTQVYPTVGVDLNVELIHTTQFLHGLLTEGRIKVSSTEATATYHDPCILVNDLGITTAPRDVLAALGFEITEPVYSRKETHCCGALPGVRIGDADVTRKVNQMRLNEVMQTGADVYVSACPTCKSVLSEADMKDITELVAERLVDE
ncbi:MAG: (Fe-S)-binding protein [Chloroflexota bacterium]|nr:(Fe-S)-binding protein [Chloroflexota bacterium]